MKCKGVIHEKNKMGKKVERICGENLADHQIFCHKCGTSTRALSTDLSSKRVRSEAWQSFKEDKGKFLPFGIFILLAVFSLLGLSLIYGVRNLIDNNLFLLFVVPLALIPFSFERNFAANPFNIGMFFRNLKYYPKFFLFTLINILYFVFLKILCTGFALNIATDPILHLVRFILVLYWIAIMFPAPILMVRKNINPFKAIALCYKASAETRWQQFFVVVSVGIANLVGLALAGLGLLVTIPFSYVLIERYYLKMDEYELFETAGRGYHV